MLFYVPTIGDTIHLEQDWTFDLYYESRNDGLLLLADFTEKEEYQYQYMKKPKTRILYRGQYSQKAGQFTLPRGTELKIDRIYIRGRAREYDSITFRVVSCPDKTRNKKRFWVKLRDANRIRCSLQPVYDLDAPVGRFEGIVEEIDG